MAVKDKELIINGKAIRSPEQQVYKNMKDIEDLQEVIKPEYKCTTELNTSATSVAKSYTNAGEDVDSGWLLDPVGKKFKITGGDEDSLLIVFYTSYQGPQGPSGVSAIDDNSVSLEKVWSSQKVFNEFARAKDKGVYITSTEPTLSDDVYTLVGNTDITNRNTDVPIKANDLVIYIDSNDEPTSIYKVLTNTGISQNLTLSKIGDYAKGKQLYQHNIDFTRSGWDIHCPVKIITDNATAFTKATFLSWLSNNSFDVSNPYQVAGYIWVDSTQYQAKGIYPYNSDIAIQYCSGKNATAFNSNVNIDVTDNVVAI